MARALWSGSISFGLVNTPVRLMSATAEVLDLMKALEESVAAAKKNKGSRRKGRRSA